jgi:lysophospholipase L1-like esterase
LRKNLIVPAWWLLYAIDCIYWHHDGGDFVKMSDWPKKIAVNAVIFVVAFGYLWPGSAGHLDAKESAHDWVGTWATAPMKAPAPQTGPAPEFDGCTLRQIVHVSAGGKRVRVKFSNAFGNAPLKVAAVHIALSAGESTVNPGTDKPLTFNGQASATVPPGAPFVSDPVDFDLPALADLTISMKLDTVPRDITFHNASHATSYLENGEAVAAAELASAKRIEHWYFLSAVDVEADRSASAVVALGDSITDGTASTTNKNLRWPDVLARRLQANKKLSHIGVLNVGIGGNRILHDGAGESALARLDRDVLSQSGVRYLIILEGINDIGNNALARSRGEEPVRASDLIGGFEQIIARAHAHHVLVYGATILPYEGAKYYSQAGEADREEVNKWIRTSGKLDGFVDLDAATRDPQDALHLVKAADSGDHLHPADEGYRMMGDAVNLKLFSR